MAANKYKTFTLEELRTIINNQTIQVISQTFMKLTLSDSNYISHANGRISGVVKLHDALLAELEREEVEV